MGFDNNKIVEALRTVIDPETGLNIIDAKKLHNFRIDGNNISFSLVLKNADARTKGEINFASMKAVQDIYPGADVHIHMEQNNGEQATTGALPQVKNIIAVASGKGGVGKSTVSTNLALGLKAKGFKVGIMDADLYGPSIPTMLGLRGQKPEIRKIYGNNKIVPLEKYGLYVMSIGFVIDEEQAVVLRGPRLGGIIKQFIHDCVWPELDFLIIDLPPGTGDIQLSLVQTVPVLGAIMVTTPQQVSVADAIKAMNMFLLENINVPILGVVENMSWFTPAELPENKYLIFGEGGGKELAKRGGTQLLGQIPIVQSIREKGDSGAPEILKEEAAAYPYFMQIIDKLLVQLESRNAKFGPTKVVKVEQ
jgi:ATP-binding protein involved in chromosome partitioning